MIDKRRTYLLAGLLLAAPALAAQEVDGFVLPDVDLAESIRQQLRAAPASAEAESPSARQEGPDEASSSALPAGPVPDPPEEIAVPPVREQELRSRQAVPNVPESRTSAHIPLPEKEVTIRSLEDIRGLAKKFEDARQGDAE